MVDKDTIDTEYEKVQKNIEKIIAEMEDLTKQQVDQVNEKESIGKIIFRKDSYKIEKVVRLFRSVIYQNSKPLRIKILSLRRCIYV